MPEFDPRALETEAGDARAACRAKRGEASNELVRARPEEEDAPAPPKPVRGDGEAPP